MIISFFARLYDSAYDFSSPILPLTSSVNGCPSPLDVANCDSSGIISFSFSSWYTNISRRPSFIIVYPFSLSNGYAVISSISSAKFSKNVVMFGL